MLAGLTSITATGSLTLGADEGISDAGAFRQRLQFGPSNPGYDRRMSGKGGESAVGSCNDVLSPHEFREPHDTLRDQIGVFDVICA